MESMSIFYASNDFGPLDLTHHLSFCAGRLRYAASRLLLLTTPPEVTLAEAF